MASTTNFGWNTPDNTDLVKDGALAIRTLGNAIDTSMADLRGGTTGQILAKQSNTDMDFQWIANDQGDITEVVAGTGLSGGGTSGSVTLTNTVATTYDAKGDLVVGTGADTFSKLTVGTNNHVLTADSTTATGLKWAAPSASGGMTLLASGTLSGASVSLTSISQDYINLVLIVRDFLPALDGENFSVRFNEDSTANRHAQAQAAENEGGSFAGTQADITAKNDNSVANGLLIATFPDYTNTVTWKFVFCESLMVNQTTTTNYNSTRRMGFYNQTGALTSLTLKAAAGNLTSGSYLLYGVK